MDLTDEQSAVSAPLVAWRLGPGRPPTVGLWADIQALLYMEQAGCPWRVLPSEFPHSTSVRHYFDQWTRGGTSEELNRRLVE